MPNILVNLISTTRLKKKGLFYYIEKDYLYTRIHNDKRILADVIERNNLPQLKVVDSNAPVTENAFYLSKTVTLVATTEVWYLRLSYLYERTLATMVKTGQIEIKGLYYLADCVIYRKALAKKVYRRLPTLRPTQVYTLVYIDVVIVREPAYNKCKYYTLFTEARALYRYDYPSQFKGQAAVYIKEHRRLIQIQTGLEIPVYIINGGKEYSSNKLTAFANDSSI